MAQWVWSPRWSGRAYGGKGGPYQIKFKLTSPRPALCDKGGGERCCSWTPGRWPTKRRRLAGRSRLPRRLRTTAGLSWNDEGCAFKPHPPPMWGSGRSFSFPFLSFFFSPLSLFFFLLGFHEVASTSQGSDRRRGQGRTGSRIEAGAKFSMQTRGWGTDGSGGGKLRCMTGCHLRRPRGERQRARVSNF